jgi:PAS domain S-box-containing protein
MFGRAVESPAGVAAGLPTALLDALSDAVLVLDPTGRVRHANRAALRTVGHADEADVAAAGAATEATLGLEDWLDLEAATWVRAAIGGEARPLSAGRRPPQLSRLDARHWALLLPAVGGGPSRGQAVMPMLPMADPALREVHGMLWGSPFPATLQDESFRLLDVNQAYADLVGLSRERLVGRDPIDWQPEADRPATLADRQRLAHAADQPDVPALVEARVLDVHGQPRWVRSARYLTLTQDGRRLVLCLMHETTAEHAAREQAEYSSRELDHWFDLSPLGLVLFDHGGLVLRANLAFEALVGGPLVELRDAPPEVRGLLQWQGAGLAIALEPGGPWVTLEGALPRPEGGTRWVRALLRCYEARSGQRRYMGMLEDRTAEEERDLAQQQLGALVETAGIGVASVGGGTAGQAAGHTAGHAAGGSDAHTDVKAGHRGAALQAIRRELVLPASLPEFERLQTALRQAERWEARYAIQHPELGLRWLLTRVEPGRLASGRPTTSVVTLDVTEQHKAQERAEQLLAQLSTILESSPAGIASMRGYTLMHCNRLFERVLRLPAGAGVGSDIRALLATRTRGLPDAQALARALEQGTLFEAEIEVRGDDGALHWYALTVRRTGAVDGHAGETPQAAPQAIALLSEITRLKTQQAELAALAAERSRMAQVLGQQADRTRAVLDSVLVGIVTVNEHGTISWLNRSARRMFGGDLGDFLGHALAECATDDDFHPFSRCGELLADLRDGEAVKFECRVRGRDGRTFWVVGNAVATVGVDATRELTLALMDIEQRRQAESRIADARASLQRIIEAAPMAITLWHGDSLEVQQMNRVAAQLTGMEAEGAVGRTPEQLYPPALATRIRHDLYQALSEPQAVTEREVVFETRHGRQVWDARYLPMAARDGQPAQLLMVASDVTAQRAAQRAELEAAIAQREMLVQEVHHRIKNNLQGVAGLMQQVAARRPEVQPVIAELVGQVQAIAQVYGLQVGKVGPLRVHSVVEAIVLSVQRTFGRQLEFSAAHDGPDWMLPEAESIPIALTLNELLTNAVKHSPPGSLVACRLVAHAVGVRVEIVNEGALPPDFRLEQRPQAVSGLGLVRALLPRRHATLSLEQRDTHIVATVTLSQPVVRLAEAGQL